MSFRNLSLIGRSDWPRLPNNYGPRRWHEGICLHTPENAGPSLNSLLGTFRWQADTGGNGGSYNLGVALDGTTSLSGNAVIVESVPWDAISGGISTRRDHIWAPERFPWLSRLYTPSTYNDPNNGLVNVTVSGRAAWWRDTNPTRYSQARNIIEALTHIVVEFERRYNRGCVISEHLHWQTNRYDASRDGHLTGLILARYRDMTAPTPITPPSTENPLMIIRPTKVYPEGTIARFAAKTSFNVFEVVGAGDGTDPELRRHVLTTGDRATSAPVSHRASWEAGDDNGWAVMPRAYVGGRFRENVYISNWGPQPIITEPEPVTPDTTADELANYVAKLESAQAEIAELTAAVEELESGRADVTPEQYRETLEALADAQVAADELEGIVEGYRHSVRDYLDAADRLRELAG